MKYSKLFLFISLIILSQTSLAVYSIDIEGTWLGVKTIQADPVFTQLSQCQLEGKGTWERTHNGGGDMTTLGNVILLEWDENGTCFTSVQSWIGNWNTESGSSIMTEAQLAQALVPPTSTWTSDVDILSSDSFLLTATSVDQSGHQVKLFFLFTRSSIEVPIGVQGSDFYGLVKAAQNSGVDINEIIDVLNQIRADTEPAILAIMSELIISTAGDFGIEGAREISIVFAFVDMANKMNTIANADNETKKFILIVDLIETITIEAVLDTASVTGVYTLIRVGTNEILGVDDVDIRLPDGTVIENAEDLWPLSGLMAQATFLITNLTDFFDEWTFGGTFPFECNLSRLQGGVAGAWLDCFSLWYNRN